MTVPERDKRRVATPYQRKIVLDSGPCVYCGGQASVVDHVIPWSQGGPTTLENLAPACLHCNTEKLDGSVQEWQQWREARGLPWPPLSRVGQLTAILHEEAAKRGLTVEDLVAEMNAELDARARERSNARIAPPDR